MRQYYVPVFSAIVMGLIFCSLASSEKAPTSQAVTTTTATTKSPAIIRGVVSAKYHRLIKPANDPQMAQLLKRFETPAAEFSYKKSLRRDEKSLAVWTITFPSPFRSADACNNIVWGEYFQAKVKGSHPAVIVLHPLDSRPDFMRLVCEKLAMAGMDSMWIRMAYFGERASQGILSQVTLLQRTENLVSAISQSVMDIRRTTEFLSAQPNVDSGRIYLCGGSLGALVGSLAMGVDGNYGRAAFVLGGGNLSRMFVANQAIIKAVRMTHPDNKDLTPEDVARDLRPIDPLTYVDRTGNTQVLMINARNDSVIPPESSKELASRMKNVELVWYDGGHNDLNWDIVIKKVLAFLSQ